MKVRFSILLLSLSLLAGCANRAATAPVPGQLNSYDAYAFRALADTQAALNAFKSDVTSGKVTETPAIKTALNQAIADYDTANGVYQAWRSAGGSTTAAATSPITSAIAKLQADVTSVIGGVQ